MKNKENQTIEFKSSFKKGSIYSVLEQIVKMTTQLLTIVLIAKYLGPQDLGILMYCYAIVTIFLFLNNLGLDTILVKKFINLSSKKNSYFSHALFLRLIASIVCIGLANFTGLFLIDDKYRLLLFIISLLHLLTPVNLIVWYMRSLGKAHESAIALMIGEVMGFIFRIIVLYTSGSLLLLGFAYFIELFFMTIGLIVLFYKNGGQVDTKISKDRSINLLKESSPLIISGALALLYMKVDQIMLGVLYSTKEVGLYTAATRLSEAWFFIGMTIIGVYYPKFLSILKQYGEKNYLKEIHSIGIYVFWGAVLLAIGTDLLSEYIIDILYAPEFTKSALILSISIWSVPFVYLGTISSKMYITQSKNKAIFWRSLVGLIVNIVFNIPLINLYGGSGAAISTVFSQFVVGFLFNISNKQIFSVQKNIILFKLSKEHSV